MRVHQPINDYSRANFRSPITVGSVENCIYQKPENWHSFTFVGRPKTSRKKAEMDLSQANRIVGNSRSLKQKLDTLYQRLG